MEQNDLKIEKNANSKITFYLETPDGQHSFMQLGFSQTEQLTKSPVEYWFIKTKTQVFIQKNDDLIKTKWN